MSARTIPTWTAPSALGLVTVVGLLAALFDDGMGDVLSWIALAAPVAVALWYGVMPAKVSARNQGACRSRRRPAKSPPCDAWSEPF